MITDNKIFSNKKLSGLLKGITSNHDGDFYCLNCFHSYTKTTTKKDLKSIKGYVKTMIFCHVKMPDENNKIFYYNPRETLKH